MTDVGMLSEWILVLLDRCQAWALIRLQSSRVAECACPFGTRMGDQLS